MYLVFGGVLSFKEGFFPLFFLHFYLKYFVYNTSAHFKSLRIIRLINAMETLGNGVIGKLSFALCSQYLRGSCGKHLLFQFSQEMFQDLVFFEGMNSVLQVL